MTRPRTSLPIHSPAAVTRRSTGQRALLCVMVAVAILSIHGAVPAAQRTSGWGGMFATPGEGARAMAMGGAFCSLADDGTATYWNPAGLFFQRNNNLTFHYNQPYELSFLNHFYMGITKTADRFGSGGLDFSMTTVELADGDYSEFSFGYGYAHGIGDRFAIGASIHYLRVNTDIEEISANGFKISTGFLCALPGNLKAGFLVRNLVSHVGFSTGEDDRLPVQGVLGLSTRVLDMVTLSVDFTGSEEDLTKKVAAGAEVCLFDDTFFLRGGGYRTFTEPERFTPAAGLGLRYRTLLMDYAFEADDDILGNTHRFSVNLYY